MALPDSGVEIVVDSKLDGNYPKKTYETLVDLALKCASFEKNTRPTMKVCTMGTKYVLCPGNSFGHYVSKGWATSEFECRSWYPTSFHWLVYRQYK